MSRIIALALALGGCAPSADVDAIDAPAPDSFVPTELSLDNPTGSSSVAAVPGGYAFADPDGGAVEIRDAAGTRRVRVGTDPVRITAVGPDLAVTLAGDGAVVKLAADGRILARADVGPEPYGIIARGDGARIWVAVSGADRVLELDGATLEVVRTFEVEGEPRWLALTSDARRLFVASARGDAPILEIDLATGEQVSMGLPPVTRQVGDGRVPLQARITGDPSWSLPLRTLAVPVLYADTTTPVSAIEDADAGEVEPTPVVPPDGGVPPGEEDSYSATAISEASEVTKMTPSVVAIADDGGSEALYAAAGVLCVDARTPITGVVARPDGSLAAIVEGSDGVVVLKPRRTVGEPDRLSESTRLRTAGEAGMGLVSMVGVWTPHAPTGALSVGDEIVVVSTISRTVTVLEQREIDQEFLANNGVNHHANYRAAPVAQRMPDVLPADVARGRKLFHSGLPPMSAGGVSCASCHAGGGTDGWTWTFAEGPRQTPSLAGVVSETLPLTWANRVDTLGLEVQLTVEHRMGGEALSAEDEAALAAYIDWTRPVRRPAPDAAAVRGRALFERADVGCASCHSGARGTDGQSHRLRGLALDTPALDGVGATGPWLHDGSAQTLRDVLDPKLNGGMGNTAHLSEAELDDLVAYLRSR